MTSSARLDFQWAVDGGLFPTHAEQREKAHKLLERLVGFSPVVEHDDNGAPYIAGHPELHISISHCRVAVAVAVSHDGHVGIDVECRRRVSPSLLERVCTAEEKDSIEASDDRDMEFLRFWTRKEAVLKCRRTGIKGFGSMMDASTASDCEIIEIDAGLPDVVAALATAAGGSASRRN